jgi:hypothetical protein
MTIQEMLDWCRQQKLGVSIVHERPIEFAGRRIKKLGTKGDLYALKAEVAELRLPSWSGVQEHIDRYIHFGQWGGHTTCILYIGDETIAIAEAKCLRTEKFDRRLGVEISLGRCISQVKAELAVKA